MELPSETIDLIQQIVGFCLQEAAPGNPFNGRLVTSTIDDAEQGIMAVIAGEDSRAMGQQMIRKDAAKLHRAIIVTDVTLTSPDGEQRDGALIDLYQRGQPAGITLVQFYRHGADGEPAAPVDTLKLMGSCEQLL